MSKSKFLSCVKSDGQFGFCSVIFGWDCELKPSPLYPSSLHCPLASLLSASSFSFFHCCYLLTQKLSPLVLRSGTRIQLTTVHDTTHFNELLVSNRANGYRDLLAVIDLSTYRRLSWEKNLPFFLVSFIVPETGEYLAVDPRSALKGVLEKAEEKGWTCMSGAEFEVGPVSNIVS
jgi:hypothetical protein